MLGSARSFTVSLKSRVNAIGLSLQFVRLPGQRDGVDLHHAVAIEQFDAVAVHYRREAAAADIVDTEPVVGDRPSPERRADVGIPVQIGHLAVGLESHGARPVLELDTKADDPALERSLEVVSLRPVPGRGGDRGIGPRVIAFRLQDQPEQPAKRRACRGRECGCHDRRDAPRRGQLRARPARIGRPPPGQRNYPRAG